MAGVTLMPFLYPWLCQPTHVTTRAVRQTTSALRSSKSFRHFSRRSQSTTTSPPHDEISSDDLAPVSDDRSAHLNPAPESYSTTPFTDRCTLQLVAGSGGHGCISFLREKYIPNGPANGGDGGTGGSIYIQAVRGETSLHKLARRGILKAPRGRNGQGKSQGGERGEDLLIQVPVGTIVREIWRHDPSAEQEREEMLAKTFGADAEEPEPGAVDNTRKWRRDKWLLYPGAMPANFTSADFPPLPRPRRSNLSLSQPEAPVYLDLDTPTEAPLLLASGAMGGLGNPHFVTKNIPRPKFATKGDNGMKLEVQLELKLLADVGLVGLPNAGKSTLLRSISNSRTRVGSWAFTTLAPSIGTVVLDDYKGRPALAPTNGGKYPRTNFTIADIPGLIEDAHLDKGLGLGFLRHIERAGILAFVVDLSAGDAVTALQGLWTEVGQYELLRDRELNAETERRHQEAKAMTKFTPLSNASPQIEHDAFSDDPQLIGHPDSIKLPPLRMPPISSKPWLVIATKADLAQTQDNFAALQAYLDDVADGVTAHPSGQKNAWRKRLRAVPVSAIRAEGTERIPPAVVDLLGDI